MVEAQAHAQALTQAPQPLVLAEPVEPQPLVLAEPLEPPQPPVLTEPLELLEVAAVEGYYLLTEPPSA